MSDLTPDLQATLDAGQQKLEEVQQACGWSSDEDGSGGCGVDSYIEALESATRELGITQHLLYKSKVLKQTVTSLAGKRG